MSKKSKRPRTHGAKAPSVSQPSPGVQPPAVATAASKGHLLAELKALAAQHVANKEWGALVQLGRTALADICEPDRGEADTWLLRVKIVGLYPDQSQAIHNLSKEARTEVEELLSLLANRADMFHREPEFNLYIDTLGYSLEETVQAFQHLTRACMDVSNLQWVRKLRGRALRLLAPEEYFDEDLTNSQQALLASLPDIYVVLSEVYATAETSALDDEGTLLVKVLKLELDMLMAEPWDYGNVADAIARLPSPGVAELALVQRVDYRWNVRQQLIPRDWGLLWELGHIGSDGLTEVLERYRGGFGNDACEGLYLIAQSIVSEPERAGQLLTQAVTSLMKFLDEGTEWFGESVTIGAVSGPYDVYIGQLGLRLPTVDTVLVRLCELAPKGYCRDAELLCFCRVFVASMEYSSLDDDDAADEHMEGLDWLCTNSISFQFAAASVVHGVAGRMRLLLDVLRRCLEDGVSPPRNYFAGDLGGEELDPRETVAVLDCLDMLVPLRDQMDEGIERMWRAEVVSIFKTLCRVEEAATRSRTLDLAREFREDLLAKGESFRLGYLEQVAGDAELALGYYLVSINTSKELLDAAVENAKILWLRSNELEQVQSMVYTLEEAVKTSSRPSVIQQLLVDAKPRLATLTQQSQFEQTAVNRWPTITGPARKLLGVFATIQRYSSFRELGEYAGMDEVWAERHYKKLVETGMLIVTATGYHINPYIAPHLERESQHAVVGRIVRSQGTSAVKQVFNSQREFTIYQVLVQLCPNHLVFPNSSLQSIMSYDRMKELVTDDDFGYYLRASVDIVVVSSTTYLPMLAIEVDSVWHDTERQQTNDGKKDRIFAAGGVPFMRLRPLGSPSENAVRAQVAEHVDDLVRTLRLDMPGYDQARGLLEDLSGLKS